MSVIKDDSQQVLSILNSLGYIGITAEQLKAFMKDLKLYRKLKERERLQWKEETTRKFFYKQQKALLDLFQECSNEQLLSHKSTSPIKIKIKYAPDMRDEAFYYEKQQQPYKIITPSNLINNKSSTVQRKETSSSKIQENNNTIKLPTVNLKVDKQKSSEDKESLVAVGVKSSQVKKTPEKLQKSDEKKESSQSTDQKEQMRIPSGSSLRTQSKTFIRPWRLQSASRVSQKGKTDPVMLYQKYQKEWKRISFPGENRHADIRWAIREKMLGIDPNPKPVIPKTNSLLSMKKR